MVFGALTERLLYGFGGGGDVGVSGGEDSFSVFSGPLNHHIQRLHEGESEWGDGVFDFGRDGGEDLPGDHAVLFQSPHGEGKHSRRDVGDLFAKDAEAASALLKFNENEERPAVSEAIQDGSNRAVAEEAL